MKSIWQDQKKWRLKNLHLCCRICCQLCQIHHCRSRKYFGQKSIEIHTQKKEKGKRFSCVICWNTIRNFFDFPFFRSNSRVMKVWVQQNMFYKIEVFIPKIGWIIEWLIIDPVPYLLPFLLLIVSDWSQHWAIYTFRKSYQIMNKTNKINPFCYHL